MIYDIDLTVIIFPDRDIILFFSFMRTDCHITNGEHDPRRGNKFMMSRWCPRAELSTAKVEDGDVLMETKRFFCCGTVRLRGTVL